ncbi:MAG: tape measure protein, partial [Tepidisphaeraceae bacterium]
MLQPLGLLPGRIGAIASRVSSLSGTVSRAASAFASGGSGVIAQASGIAGSAGQATAGIAGMGTALGVLAGAAAVAAGPIGGFLIEQTRIAFTTMAGSAAIAKTTLADLQKFADTTPFQFPEVSQAAKQLLAMGFDAKEVTGELRMLGDVSSGLNQPLGEIAYLYGQVKSRGSASAMELREFAMRGIPIYNELAKVLGVSVEQVRKLTSEGSVGFDQIQAAFRSMTSEGGRFHDLTQKQAESLEGLQSTAADAYAAIQRDIGEVVTANLKLKQTTSDQIDLVNAIHPLAVGVIDDLTKKLDVFIDSYQSILKLTTELAKDASFLKGAFEDAFGKNFISNLETIQKYVNPLNLTIMAIKEAVDGVTWALKRARENLSAGAWLEGEGAAMDKANHQKITKQEVQDKIAKAGKSPAAKGAGITPAAESDTGGFGGGSSEGSGGGAGGRGAAGGMKEWHKTQELAWATYISNLRAAGQEAAARIAELDEKLQKDLAAAKTDDEVRAI